jgi:hypothetical protein
MIKELNSGDVFSAVLRDPNGESMTIRATVDDQKTVQGIIDGSTSTIRVYMVDGTMIAQYIDAFIIFATCTRIGMTFTQRDAISMMALVMSVVNETPGTYVVPNAVVEALAFTDPLF